MKLDMQPFPTDPACVYLPEAAGGLASDKISFVLFWKRRIFIQAILNSGFKQ